MHSCAKLAFFLLLLILRCWPQSSGHAGSPQDLLSEGKKLFIQEGPNAALPRFQKALDIFRAQSDRRGEAIAVGYIANCQRKLGNLEQALDLAQQALHMKEDLGDRDETGNTHSQLGLIYWELSDYPNAIQHLNTAIEIGSALDDKELEGSARNNLGLVFDERGDYQHSLEQYQRALDLHRKTHFERGEGDTLGNIGGVYLLLGKFREALPYYQQAQQISERLGLKPALSVDLGNIALCLAGMGDADAALESFDRAAQIARESGLAKEEADWRRDKGTTLVGLGRYDAALKEYSAAELVYERSGLQQEMVEALTDTGIVYESMGDSTAAETRFQRALQLARKIGSTEGESEAALALGDLERRRRRNDEADKYFQSALAHARSAGEDGTIVDVLLHLGRNETDRKHYDQAREAAEEASAVSERLGNRPAIAQSHYVLGEVQRSQADFAQALQEFDSAENLQKELRDPELGWRVHYGRGQTLEAMDRTAEAIDSYKQAIAIIEQTRVQISEQRFRAGYIEDRYQVYVALVELLLKLGKAGEAFLYSEKLRARAYFDQMGPNPPAERNSQSDQHIRELAAQIRTLRREIEKEYATPEKDRRGQALEFYSAELDRAERDYQDLLDNARSFNHAENPDSQVIPSVPELQHFLSADKALLEFVVGKQSVSAFLMTPESVVGIPISVSSDALTSRVELLRGLITRRSPLWADPARGMFQLLLTPIERDNQLHGIRQLLIIPDSVLNYVPFAALPDSRGKFLGDRYQISYLPAASALTRKAVESGSRKLLAVAPDEPELRNTAAEIRGIGTLFPSRSRLLFGKQATETLFKQVAGDYDYLHLATHGGLNRNAPSLSALQLEPDAQNDGRLELHEIARLKLHARLVTLSACETALGSGYFTETPAGDEFVGMTRAFLGAGSRAVMASLWPVNDESTSLLMMGFYRHLLRKSDAQALAEAQREFRNANPRYRHPYYWAPFIIVGAIN